MRIVLLAVLTIALAAADAPRLTVVTWNVLYQEATWAERLPRLHAALTAAAPDVVCVQECSPAMRDALAAGLWARALHDSGEPVGGLCVWSRHPQRAQAVALPSQQRRSGLLTVLDAPGGALAIGVVHLDSPLAAGPVRARQLAVMEQALSAHGDALLVGDFNYGDGETDGDALARAWRDAWPLLHPGMPGFTWDLVRNPRAPAQSFPDEPSRRIDRVLARGAWIPVTAEIIGAELPTGSDHLGLRVALERR